MSSDESVGDGGVIREPKLKKRRTDRDGEGEFQHDGPVEDEETAREKMKEAGFDPDDVTKECALSESACERIGEEVTLLIGEMHPMTYFCLIGDLKMCRYLLSKGASTTATSTCGWWFPMYAAAFMGPLDVCKWLYDHGAKEDVGRRNGETSPLQAAVSQYCIDRKNTSRWFILKGALSLNDKPGFVYPRLMRRDVRPRSYDERPQLQEWAKQSIQTHSGFMTFLLGTLPAPTFTQAALTSLLTERLQTRDAAEMVMADTPAHRYECLWSKITKRTTTPVCYLGGEKIGILELIADYAGVVRGRDLRILRSLINPLSEYLKEIPEGGYDPEEYETDEDDETDEEEDDE